jgi:D-sedoheptulose 7-phosphate isomerase
MIKHFHTFFNRQNDCNVALREQYKILESIINVLQKAQKNGKTIFTFGNGGSGSTASHFVSDLLKTAITKGNKRFAAISLVDNTPVNLAWSNDQSFDAIFIEQLKNFLKKNDVVFAFSGSGKSKNVIQAIKYAKKNNATCIGFTGMDGGELKKICDLCIIIPSSNMLTIESTHLIICHCIIDFIRKSGKPLFKYD